MKKLILIMIITLLMLLNLSCLEPTGENSALFGEEGWAYIDNDSFPIYKPFPSISLDSKDDLYLSIGGEFPIKKYQNNNWINFSNNGFASDEVSTDISSYIVFDGNDTPYCIYSDHSKNNKLSVKKYNGNEWQYVGSPGFSTHFGWEVSYVFDSNNTLYIAHRDYDNNLKAVVKKFDGSDWVTVGSTHVSMCQAFYIEMAIDSNDILYVAYKDQFKDFHLTIKKFDGNSWVNVGSDELFDGEVNSISMAIDSNDYIYIAYSDLSNGLKPSLIKFNGTDWEYVGERYILDMSTRFISLVIDADDVPYIAFRGTASSEERKSSVMKYTGTEWDYVGNKEFSVGLASELKLSIDKANKLYLSFNESIVIPNGEGTIHKVSIASYSY